MMDPSALGTLLSEIFPVTVGYRALIYVGSMDIEERTTGDLFGTFQIINFDPGEGGGAKTIRDVKEQQVLLVPAPARSNPERVAAYLQGYHEALKEVLLGAKDFGSLMPHDLIQPNVLKLRRVSTAQEFQRALLVRSRLGHLIAGPPGHPGIGGPAQVDWVGGVLADLLPLAVGRFRLELTLSPDKKPWIKQTARGLEVSLHLVSNGQVEPSEKVALLRGLVTEVEIPRMRAYLLGWVDALRTILEERRWVVKDGSWQEQTWNLRRIAPRMLVCPAVLADPALEYPEEFAHALVKPEALGRHLVSATPAEP